jgi:hypothetical protein
MTFVHVQYAVTKYTVSSSTEHVEYRKRINFLRNKQENVFENLFPAGATQQQKDEMFYQMLQYR